MKKEKNNQYRFKTNTRTAKEQGMVTMEQDGVLKAIQGATTLEEIVRVI